MKFKRPLVPEVHVRLTDDLTGFVCSVQRGWFYKSKKFAIEPHPAESSELRDSVAEPVWTPYRKALRNL